MVRFTLLTSIQSLLLIFVNACLVFADDPTSGQDQFTSDSSTSMINDGMCWRSTGDIDSSDCYYLFPYNIHITPSTTSSEPLVVKDHDGNILSGTISFSYYPGFFTVSSSGYISGLGRPESEYMPGILVSASFNGHPCNNGCFVRVLPYTLPFSFNEIVTDNTVLYYPPDISGIDIENSVLSHQLATVNEYAYRVMHDLIGTQTRRGCRQIFEVDFGAGWARSVCGIAENPIRIGWDLDDNSNCLITNYSPVDRPHWFVFYHELGHEFTLASPVFVEAFDPSWNLPEGLATTMYLAVCPEITDHPNRFPLEDLPRNSLRDSFASDSAYFMNALSNWAGKDASVFPDADVIDGLWLYYYGEYGHHFVHRFFYAMNPSFYDDLEPVVSSLFSEESMHTFLCALISASVKQDVSTQLVQDFNMPLTHPLYEDAYAALSAVIATMQEPPEIDCAEDNLQIEISGPGYFPLPVLVEDADSCWSVGGEWSNDTLTVQFSGSGVYEFHIYASNAEATAECTLLFDVVFVGDADGSGAIDIDDIMYLITYVMLGGPAPVPFDSGEVNCTEDIDIDDIMYLVNYVFLGGPAPCV